MRLTWYQNLTGFGYFADSPYCHRQRMWYPVKEIPLFLGDLGDLPCVTCSV
jgi:hypothetical protein